MDPKIMTDIFTIYGPMGVITLAFIGLVYYILKFQERLLTNHLAHLEELMKEGQQTTKELTGAIHSLRDWCSKR